MLAATHSPEIEFRKFRVEGFSEGDEVPGRLVPFARLGSLVPSDPSILGKTSRVDVLESIEIAIMFVLCFQMLLEIELFRRGRSLPFQKRLSRN